MQRCVINFCVPIATNQTLPSVTIPLTNARVHHMCAHHNTCVIYQIDKLTNWRYDRDLQLWWMVCVSECVNRNSDNATAAEKKSASRHHSQLTSKHSIWNDSPSISISFRTAQDRQWRTRESGIVSYFLSITFKTFDLLFNDGQTVFSTFRRLHLKFQCCGIDVLLQQLHTHTTLAKSTNIATVVGDVVFGLDIV